MSSTVAIIQSRLGSTRLPRKALADIGGRPLLAHVVARVRETEGISRVIVATPSFADAEALAAVVPHTEFWADDSLDERDVLGRYWRCADYLKARVVMRVTGDCPLWQPRIGEQVLRLFHESGVDYASNLVDGYRDGEDVEVCSFAALTLAYRSALDANDKEHVTPWLRRNCTKALLPPAEIRSDVKTSVDTEADLARVRLMLDSDARAEHIMGRWDGLLRRLAE